MIRLLECAGKDSDLMLLLEVAGAGGRGGGVKGVRACGRDESPRQIVRIQVVSPPPLWEGLGRNLVKQITKGY